MTTAFDPVNFETLVAKETNARMRLLALAYIKDGVSRTATAKYLKVPRYSVNKWTSLNLRQGLAGIKDKLAQTDPLH
jgi:hypothetical protein